MDEEYSSLTKNHTWDLCPLSKGRNLVCCRWVYHTKYVANGSIDRYKSCLIVKDFSQRVMITLIAMLLSPRFALSSLLYLLRDGKYFR